MSEMLCISEHDQKRGPFLTTPLKKTVKFWMRHNGRKDYPKDEAEALLLHENIKLTKSCWECPNRMHCEWAVDLLKKNIELKKKIKDELKLANGSAPKKEKEHKAKSKAYSSHTFSAAPKEIETLYF